MGQTELDTPIELRRAIEDVDIEHKQEQPRKKEKHARKTKPRISMPGLTNEDASASFSDQVRGENEETDETRMGKDTKRGNGNTNRMPINSEEGEWAQEFNQYTEEEERKPRITGSKKETGTRKPTNTGGGKTTGEAPG